MKSKTTQPAAAKHASNGITWRALLPCCIEAVRAIHQPGADRHWKCDYRLSLYDAVKQLIPPASVVSYAEAAQEMDDAYTNHDGIDPECNGTLTNHAWDALHHVVQWRALIEPLSSREDVLARLEYAALLDNHDAFPDGWISYSEFFKSIAADLRRIDDEPSIRRAA